MVAPVRCRTARTQRRKCSAPSSSRSSRVTEVITTCRSPSRRHASASSIWLVGRHGLGLSPLDRTETARPSAGLAQDHERGRPPRPALGAIRATCTLADGLEPQLADQTLGEVVPRGARNGPLQPCRQAPRSVLRLANVMAFDVAGQHGQAGGIIQDWERRHAIRPCGESMDGRYRRGASSKPRTRSR